MVSIVVYIVLLFYVRIMTVCTYTKSKYTCLKKVSVTLCIYTFHDCHKSSDTLCSVRLLNKDSIIILSLSQPVPSIERY